jgi:hypothetical protein
MKVKLTLLHEDPMNTVVSDGAKPIYEVETLGNPVSKVTTLRRVLEPKAGSSTSSTTGGDAENGVVAEVEWHWSRPSSVSFPSGDRKMPLNMFLHRGGAFNLRVCLLVNTERRLT